MNPVYTNINIARPKTETASSFWIVSTQHEQNMGLDLNWNRLSVKLKIMFERFYEKIVAAVE